MLTCPPMPNAASAPEPARPEVAGDTEFVRLLSICDPGAALAGPLTFCPEQRQTRETWLAAWQQWRQTILEPVLAPALTAAAAHAQQDHAREMLSVDAELSGRLEPAAAARSVKAGRGLLQQLGRARGGRWPGKFAERVRREEAAAHFAVIYAGQSAFFYLPQRLLLPTYAFWEWSAAAAGCVFRGPKPEFAAEAAEWQRAADATLAPTFFNPLDASPNAGRAL
jgi:hypothetical protein